MRLSYLLSEYPFTATLLLRVSLPGGFHFTVFPALSQTAHDEEVNVLVFLYGHVQSSIPDFEIIDVEWRENEREKYIELKHDEEDMPFVIDVLSINSTDTELKMVYEWLKGGTQPRIIS